MSAFTNHQRVTAPRLPHDDRIFGAGVPLPAGVQLERDIVLNLMVYLKQNGFKLIGVDDGECLHFITNPDAALGDVFAVDEATLHVSAVSGRHSKQHIYLVMGNGVDIISDHTHYCDDRDGFNALMDAFDPEAFVTPAPAKPVEPEFKIDMCVRVRHVFPDNTKGLTPEAWKREADRCGALRSLLMTDKDGRVHFDAFFPGYTELLRFKAGVK